MKYSCTNEVLFSNKHITSVEVIKLFRTTHNLMVHYIQDEFQFSMILIKVVQMTTLSVSDVIDNSPPALLTWGVEAFLPPHLYSHLYLGFITVKGG